MQNVKIRVIWGLGVIRGQWQCHHLLFNFNKTLHLYCTISSLPIITYPTCIWRHNWGWPRLNFAQTFDTRKPVTGLSCGVVCVIVCVIRHVTDTQTDTVTRRRHRVYCRSVKMNGRRRWMSGWLSVTWHVSLDRVRDVFWKQIWNCPSWQNRGQQQDIVTDSRCRDCKWMSYFNVSCFQFERTKQLWFHASKVKPDWSSRTNVHRI